MPIIIAGFSASTKRPGFFGEVKFGAGPIAIGSIPLTLLLVGLSTSAGTMVPDVDVLTVSDTTTLETYAGAGSELARMGYQALKVAGLQIKIATPTNGGGVAAVATVTIGGSWTAAGTLGIRIGGKLVTCIVNAGDTTDQVGVALAAAINADPTLPVTAVDVTSVVTLTVKRAGIRGNQYILFKDLTSAPTGLTAAVAGGASVTGGGVLFHNGTVAETMTTLLATIYPGLYDRVAIAQNDSVSLAAWKVQQDAKATAPEGRREHAVFATNGTLAACASLAGTTLNDARFQACWLLNSESHPSEIAAAMAALRTQTEQSEPNSGYDSAVLVGIAPQSQIGDVPTAAVQETALGEGVTPLITAPDGTVQVVRAITTHTLNGSNPDYRTLDTAQSTTPDYVLKVIDLDWTTNFVLQNPHVEDDPDTGAGEKPAAAGVATPTLWNKRIAVLLAEQEEAGRLTKTALNQPATYFDNSGATPHLVSAVPTIPTPLNHQSAVQVLQFNA